jgi:hypothetical protein
MLMPLGLDANLEYTQLGHLNRLCRVFSGKTPKAAAAREQIFTGGAAMPNAFDKILRKRAFD